MIAFLKVKFLNQIGSLSSIEAGNNIQRLIIEGKSSMEVSFGVKICHLCPGITLNVVNFAFVHTFLRQR